MSSDQSSASAQAARTQGGLATSAYAIGLPALNAQYGYLNSSIAEGGEPGYVADAFDSQRTGLTEGLARQGQGQMRQQLMQQKAAALGGNAGAALTPSGMGAQIANQLYGSRVNEGLGQIEQLNKLLAMGMGQSAQAGSASIGAGQQQLQGIAGLPQYNQTYANVLGLANIGAVGYGGYQQFMAGQQAAYNKGGV